MARVKNSAVVARQLPEHIREDYPTFVAFVEAYYEFLQSQNVDFSQIRDIDDTLDNFIVQFKKELAYNLPNVSQDEKFLLQRIKDQYLAKGSESSYNLLFRLLYGKDVQVFYPGRQMLRVSDGRWNQEISVFAKVDFGNPDDVVGKLVDIQTAGRTLRVVIDKKQDLVGDIDRIVLVDPTQQIYEFFLDKRFFGVITPGDRIRYLNQFQATILPTTKEVSIIQPGKNFRVGQVFELRSGNGTGALLKVTQVTNTGGIRYAELIKFGIGYTANFAISILSTNSVTSRNISAVSGSSLIEDNTYTSDGAGTISASANSTTVTGSGTSFGSVGNPKIGDELWTTDSSPLLIGVIKSVESGTSLTLTTFSSEYGNSISDPYTGSYTFRNNDGVGTPYAPGGTQSLTYASNLSNQTLGFNEQGYVNLGDYVHHDFIDGTYAGTLIREFTLNFRNAQTAADEPAIINIDLGAIARYPGYFETNNGFLNDSIYIQDSKYYQAFSYVLKIDERLNSYKSAVKTMIHPAGMALFGEFDITNTYDLGVALESLVKSLGVSLDDEISTLIDSPKLTTTKTASDSIETPLDSIVVALLLSYSSSFNAEDDELDLSLSKNLSTTVSIEDSIIVEFILNLSTSLNTPTDVTSLSLGKNLSSSLDTPNDSVSISTVYTLTSSLDTPTDNVNITLGKNLSSSIDTPEDSNFELVPGYTLTTSYSDFIDTIDNIEITKSLEDSSIISENLSNNTTKYVDEDLLSPQEEEGYVGLNTYFGQDYVRQTDEYSVGSRQSTFTNP
jgi:hypothetical protein